MPNAQRPKLPEVHDQPLKRTYANEKIEYQQWTSAKHPNTSLRCLLTQPRWKKSLEASSHGVFLLDCLIISIICYLDAPANSYSGILHTIFFHRYFPSIRPKTRDVLDMTLPYIENVEIETLIDQRTAALVRQLDTNSDLGARNTGVRGQMAIQFFEKKRRKAWFTKGVCWAWSTIPMIRIVFPLFEMPHH